MAQRNERILYGIHPVARALEFEKKNCHKLTVLESQTHPRVLELAHIAREIGILVEVLPREVFAKKYRNFENNQGVVGYFSIKPQMSLDELVSQAFCIGDKPILAVLDGVQDPHNLGAIIRSAEALGINGVIIPSRRASPLNETVAKCSAGAIESLSIVSVNNVALALEKLKKAGFWVVGLDEAGETPCQCLDYDMPIAFLIGSEGKGIRPLLKKKCDFTAKILMRGSVGSLNVSSASAVVFYEAMRGRNSGNYQREKPDEYNPPGLEK